MRIMILGQFTFPEKLSIKDFLDEDEPLYHSVSHPHPWISNLAQALARINNNEVHVFMMIGDIKKDRLIKYEGVDYHLIKSTPIPLKALTFFKSNKWKIHRLIKEINPDIVHGQSRGRESYFAVSSGFPCVVTNHGQIEEHYNALLNGKKNIEYFIYKWKENRVNKRMRYCIGVSPNCTKDCLKFLPKENVFLIDNAVNPVFFANYNVTYDNTILFAGSVSNRKKTMELVKAIEKVKEAELHIATFTNSGKYYNKVNEYIEDHNLSDRIKFLGMKNQEELAEEMSKCLAVCLPSTYESFGMVLAEAMAVGKPVIGSNVDGIRHVIKDNITGFLVEPGNADQIADKISFLINNKRMARKMGQNAKQEALHRWHPDIVAKKTYEVYKEILSNL